MTDAWDKAPKIAEDPDENPPKGHGKICPRVANPARECYCTHPTSLNIPLIVYFCGGKYLECEIFLSGFTPPAAPPR